MPFHSLDTMNERFSHLTSRNRVVDWSFLICILIFLPTLVLPNRGICRQVSWVTSSSGSFTTPPFFYIPLLPIFWYPKFSYLSNATKTRHQIKEKIALSRIQNQLWFMTPGRICEFQYYQKQDYATKFVLALRRSWAQSIFFRLFSHTHTTEYCINTYHR